MRFSSTPRGARLARRLVAERLDAWGHPHASAANETLTLITAELTANAVRHGHVSGRDFEVRLTADDVTLRVEVSDTRADRIDCRASLRDLKRGGPILGPLRVPPSRASPRAACAWGYLPTEGWGRVSRPRMPLLAGQQLNLNS
ncbi:ATP-binding protein [Streptomyces cellulosae]|uniref:ATP-binding protein n=1 Tax=Streptomyces cellulosae TaxID=1968 RepID=UPI000A44ED91|nr:ATP-binding protein [Streptomyces cellulosae]